mmetsp:Transcript_18337/g.53299  ORF Transcript_18337/g.53299 Transcript_18337/m.53299 type:complete len:362 (+) Transcript_18337:161-1246(+)
MRSQKTARGVAILPCGPPPRAARSSEPAAVAPRTAEATAAMNRAVGARRQPGAQARYVPNLLSGAPRSMGPGRQSSSPEQPPMSPQASSCVQVAQPGHWLWTSAWACGQASGLPLKRCALYQLIVKRQLVASCWSGRHLASQPVGAGVVEGGRVDGGAVVVTVVVSAGAWPRQKGKRASKFGKGQARPLVAARAVVVVVAVVAVAVVVGGACVVVGSGVVEVVAGVVVGAGVVVFGATVDVEGGAVVVAAIVDVVAGVVVVAAGVVVECRLEAAGSALDMFVLAAPAVVCFVEVLVSVEAALVEADVEVEVDLEVVLGATEVAAVVSLWWTGWPGGRPTSTMALSASWSLPPPSRVFVLTT